MAVNIVTDLFIRDDGDLVASSSGDLVVTDTPYRDDLQQAYIRVMTDEGDYLLYPNLGATLSQLYGMPQSPETGRLGEDLITAALNREGRFAGRTFAVKAVPVSPNTIRFDIRIAMGNRKQISLAIEQALAFDSFPSSEPEPVGLVIPDGSLYIFHSGTLQARDKHDSGVPVVWQVDLPAAVNTSGVSQGSRQRAVVMGVDHVVAAHVDHHLRAYSKQDGAILWDVEHPVENIMHVFSDVDHIHTVADEGDNVAHIRRFRQNDGALVWTSPNVLLAGDHATWRPRYLYVSEDQDFIWVGFAGSAAGRGAVRKVAYGMGEILWTQPSVQRVRSLWRYKPAGLVFVGCVNLSGSHRRMLLDETTGAVFLDGLLGGTGAQVEADADGWYYRRTNPTLIVRLPNHDTFGGESIPSAHGVGDFALDGDYVWHQNNGPFSTQRIGRAPKTDLSDVETLTTNIGTHTPLVEPGPAPFFRPFNDE